MDAKYGEERRHKELIQFLRISLVVCTQRVDFIHTLIEKANKIKFIGWLKCANMKRKYSGN